MQLLILLLRIGFLFLFVFPFLILRPPHYSSATLPPSLRFVLCCFFFCFFSFIVVVVVVSPLSRWFVKTNERKAKERGTAPYLWAPPPFSEQQTARRTYAVYYGYLNSVGLRTLRISMVLVFVFLFSSFSFLSLVFVVVYAHCRFLVFGRSLHAGLDFLSLFLLYLDTLMQRNKRRTHMTYDGGDVVERKDASLKTQRIKTKEKKNQKQTATQKAVACVEVGELEEDEKQSTGPKQNDSTTPSSCVLLVPREVWKNDKQLFVLSASAEENK
eukprot:gene3753-2649_t